MRFLLVILVALGSFTWAMTDAAYVRQDEANNEPSPDLKQAKGQRAENNVPLVQSSQQQSAIRDMWVTSDRLNRRTCPRDNCGIVGKLFFRDLAKVRELRDGFARVSVFYDAGCSNGKSAYVVSGNATCTNENGVLDGKFAEWVSTEFLSNTRPADPAERAEGVETLISQSDDFRLYHTAFAKAAKDLIANGQCSKQDFVEQGGWLKSSNAGDAPIYFTYCGGSRVADRVYLNAVTGQTFR
jgi:hypothetical protein